MIDENRDFLLAVSARLHVRNCDVAKYVKAERPDFDPAGCVADAFIHDVFQYFFIAVVLNPMIGFDDPGSQFLEQSGAVFI